MEEELWCNGVAVGSVQELPVPLVVRWAVRLCTSGHLLLSAIRKDVVDAFNFGRAA